MQKFDFVYKRRSQRLNLEMSAHHNYLFFVKLLQSLSFIMPGMHTSKTLNSLICMCFQSGVAFPFVTPGVFLRYGNHHGLPVIKNHREEISISIAMEK